MLQMSYYSISAYWPTLIIPVRCLAIAILLSGLPNSLTAQSRLDSLVRAIDYAIENRDIYVKRKEAQTNSLYAICATLTTEKSKYEANSRLFHELKHYDLNRALRAAKEKLKLAFLLNNESNIRESKMNIAEMLGKMGMYNETFNIIDTVNTATLNKEQMQYLYHIYHSTYSLLYQSALSDEEKQKYIRYAYQYKDSLLQVLDSTTLSYQLVYTTHLIDIGQHERALAYILGVYPNYKNSRERLSLDYTLSLVYESIGNTILQKEYLAKVALGDLTEPVKSYIALRKLAVLLFQQGDVTRAYTYIKCAMEDAHFAKARFRMNEISETLPIITAAYDQQINTEKKNLRRLLLISSLLASILLVCVFGILKQLRGIKKAEIALRKKTDELSAVNNQLNSLNKQLVESDHVKEVYIGYVFSICSSYINKLEKNRLIVHKKACARQYEDVIRITGSSNLFAQEIKEFFQSFDAIFLGIFPRFIEKFNALLREEERIYPKSGEFLTPELRVFALMRLGINDSGKIAQMLHYSPQTVYNYKLKLKNKALSSKEDFYNSVQTIGR